MSGTETGQEDKGTQYERAYRPNGVFPLSVAPTPPERKRRLRPLRVNTEAISDGQGHSDNPVEVMQRTPYPKLEDRSTSEADPECGEHKRARLIPPLIEHDMMNHFDNLQEQVKSYAILCKEMARNQHGNNWGHIRSLQDEATRVLGSAQCDAQLSQAKRANAFTNIISEFADELTRVGSKLEKLLAAMQTEGEEEEWRMRTLQGGIEQERKHIQEAVDAYKEVSELELERYGERIDRNWKDLAIMIRELRNRFELTRQSTDWLMKPE